MNVEILTLIAITIRLIAGVGFLVAVLPQVIDETFIKDDLKEFRIKLLAAGVTFTLIVIGTTIFQVCRLPLSVPCHDSYDQDIIAILNSIAFLAMFWFSYIIYKHK